MKDKINAYLVVKENTLVRSESRSPSSQPADSLTAEEGQHGHCDRSAAAEGAAEPVYDGVMTP